MTWEPSDIALSNDELTQIFFFFGVTESDDVRDLYKKMGEDKTELSGRIQRLENKGQYDRRVEKE